MGLIRKSLFMGGLVGGVPVVRPDSKKQRNAKRQLSAQRELVNLQRQQLGLPKKRWFDI